MPKVIWMFSGQGSQYYSMAEELRRDQPVFRAALERGDEVVRKLINASVVEEIYRTRDRATPFRRTLFTHPAIVLVEWAMADYLGSLGLKPDVLLGYSLGELTALAVAGCIAIEEALVLAVKNAELIEYLGHPGGMLAVLETAQILEKRPEWFNGTELAAINFKNNFVVAGPIAAIRATQQHLKVNGIMGVELPVSHGFHSRGMEPLATPLRLLLEQSSMQPPRTPIISATLGRISEPAKNHFGRVTREPVVFESVIRELEKEGPWLYVDAGPSGSMATAVKYNIGSDSRSEHLAIATPFGQEGRNIARLLEKLGK